MTETAMAAAKIAAAHVERETLQVDVNLPEHTARGGATAIFRTTRAEVLAANPRCWLTGMTAEESGAPLELHHFPVERCFAEAGLVDWVLFADRAKRGDYGSGPQSFDWSSFDPDHWESFVDNMHHNGRALAKTHHTGADMGVHTVPEPIWLAQGFVKDGTPFNHLETIHRSALDIAALEAAGGAA